MEFIQHTILTMPELLNYLKDGDCNYPKFLLLNEIGAACQSGNDTPNGDGEKYLLSLLSVRGRHERVIAYCSLSAMGEKHEEILTIFSRQARNRRVMPEIRRMLREQ